MRAVIRCLLAEACFVTAVPALAAPPPAAAYADYPNAATARLSPDGGSIVYIDGVDDTMALLVSNLDTGKITPVPTRNATPNWVEWKDNQTFLAALRVTTMRFGWYPIMNARLLAFKSDGSGRRQLDFDNLNSFNYSRYDIGGPPDQTDVIDLMPANPDHLLMEVPDQNLNYPAVFDINPQTGDTHEVMQSGYDVTSWGADKDGVVRDGITWTSTDDFGGSEAHVIARVSASDDWHKLNYKVDELAFSATAPNTLYALIAPRNQPASIAAINIATGAVTSTIATGPEGTLALLAHNDTMVGWAQYTTSGAIYTYTDPGWAADAATIAQATHDPSVVIIDRSDDDQRVLALVRRQGMPEATWLLDRTQNPANLAPVLSDYPDVPADQITVGRWSTVTARDGMQIPVLVTLPPGAPKTPIPFIVMPHGGPDSRDYGPFDYLVQFLTSRGYGVLQPQYRGSNGFGTAFRDAGNNQWGLAMQDDITDATKWLISQNLAIPNKICIVGGSFGGYAALEGAVKEPALYACAAAIAPVSDLPRLLHRNRGFAYSPPKTGQDTGQLQATSPAQHADRIQIPILMIDGRMDYTVWPEQTEMMEAALKAAGKTEQTVYLPNADHFFTTPADRLAILNALEPFLAQNLAGSSGTP